MNYLWAFMMLVGILWAALHGNLAQVTTGALDSAREAVTLCITNAGRYVILDGDFRGGQESRTD